MSEFVRTAAIRCGDVIVSQPRPARHGDLIRWLHDHGFGAVYPKDQGFITSAGRFVGRIEALDIARDAGQMDWESPHAELFSEDLW